MATDNPFLKAVGSSGGKAGSNPFINAATGTKPKDSSILGGIKRAAGGALGSVLNTLSAPQQAIFKPVQGIRRTLQGEGIDETFKGIGRGLGESLGLAGGIMLPGAGNSLGDKLSGPDISLTNVISDREDFKLPWGVETVGGVLTDPTTYLTLGVGGAAKSAATTAGKAGLKSLADDAAKIGIKKAVENAGGRAAVKSTLVEGLQQQGVKNADKTANKVLRDLGRARGGVGLKVPFGPNVNLVKGETIGQSVVGRGAKAGGRKIKESPLGDFMGDRFVRGARAARDTDVGQQAAKEVFTSLGTRASEASRSIDNAKTEWLAGVKATEAQGLKYTAEQDTLVREALEAGPEARAALVAQTPALAPLVEAADRIRKAIGDEQFKAGILGKDFAEMNAKLAAKVDEGIETAGRLGDEFTQAKGLADQAGRNAGQALDTAAKVKAARSAAKQQADKATGALQKAVNRVQDLEAKAHDRTFKSALADEVARAKAAVEAGYPPPGISRVYDLANDPMLIKNAEATAAKAVADSPVLRAARQRALRLGETVAAKTDEAATLKGQVGELRKLATGARKEAAKGQRQAGRLGTRAAKARRDLNKLGDELAATPEGISGMADPETYMRRLLTKEARQALKKQKDLAGRLTSPNTGLGSADQAAAQARKIGRGHTAKSLNDAIELIRTGQRGLVPQDLLDDQGFMDVAAALTKGAKGPVKLFDEGTAAPLLARQREAARAVSTAKVVEDLKAIKGAENRPMMLDASEWKAGLQSDPGLARYVEVDVPGMGKYRVPPGIKEDIKQAFWAIQPDTVEGAYKMLNKWQAFWKTQATAMLPGGIPFAMRNMRSNVYLNILDGVPPTSPAYKEAAEILTKAHKTVTGKKFAEEVAKEGVEPVLRRELGDHAAELYFEAQRRGILDKGFFDIDLEDLPSTAKELGVRGAKPDASKARRAGRFVFSPRGTLAQKGRGFNQAIEHHARFSNFIHNVNRFGDLDEAAAHTKTALFDYGDLTPFEQRIMKNVIPFYTFMRKNIPQQYKTALTDPRRLTVTEHIADAATDPVGEDAPDYMQRQGSAILKPELQKFLPKGLRGLATTSDRPLAAATQAIEPLAQLALAAAPGTQEGEAAGYAPFFRSLDQSVGGIIPSLLSQIQEEGAGKSDFTGGTLQDATDARIRRLLETIMPGIGRTTRVSPQGNAYVGGPEATDAATLSELLRFITGVRMDEVGSAAGGARASSKKPNPFLKK